VKSSLSGASWVTRARVAVNYAIPFLMASLGYLGGCRVPTPDDYTRMNDGGEARPS